MLSVLMSLLTCFADFMHTLPAKEEFSSIIIIIINSYSSSSSHANHTGIRSAPTVFVASSVLASDIRPSSALGSHHDYFQDNQKTKQHQHHNIKHQHHHLVLGPCPILIIGLIVSDNINTKMAKSSYLIMINFGTPPYLKSTPKSA